MDHLSPERRSYNMSRVKSSNTKPEKKLGSMMHQLGLRFRKNLRKLPGTPDFVLKKHNLVILLHGCFWHNHINCKYSNIPKTNSEFWKNKFEYNQNNDRINIKKLTDLNWKVKVVWECELKNNENQILDFLKDLGLRSDLVR